MNDKEIVTPSRLETLTDGIFAFSMTLLVLFIDVPKSHHLNDPIQLHNYLSTQYPQFLSYLVTFLLLANFWIMHHQISNHIKKTDKLHLWLNIVFMLFIVLLPFFSVVLGDYLGNVGKYFFVYVQSFFNQQFSFGPFGYTPVIINIFLNQILTKNLSVLQPSNWLLAVLFLFWLLLFLLFICGSLCIFIF